MASINGVSGNNLTSSLYNSANVISGLASGLDTEGMIEGLVQSYQKKIQSLSNKVTKTEWKQEVYRNIISKMYSFSSKYTSFASSTNLMSASFFNNAIRVATQGKYADKVSASGRTESDVRINSVSQLATAARYSTSSSMRGVNDDFSIMAEDGVKFGDTFTTNALAGSLTLKYGGQNVSISFDQYEDVIPDTKTVKKDDGTTEEVKLTSEEKAEAFYKMIQEKLGDAQISLSSGESKKATDLINVEFKNGRISFSDKTSGGNSVYISDASDDLKKKLGLDLEDAEKNKPATIDTNKITRYTNKTTVGGHISGKTMNVSLDGKVKSITMPRIAGDKFMDNDGQYIKGEDGKELEVNADNYVKLLQKSLDEQFGKGKLTVSNESGSADTLQLKIKAPENSDLVINTDAGKALGIGNVATNYLNTGKTLGELLPEGTFKQNYDGKEEKQDFIINGVKIGSYDSKTKLSEVLNDINSNAAAGVKVTFSQTTRQFTFVSKETGSETEINIEGGLAEKMFGSTKISDTSTASFAEAYGISWLDPTRGDKVTFHFGDEGGDWAYKFSKDTSIEEVAAKLNGSIFNFGYTAAYNKYTGELEVTDKAGAKVDFTITAEDYRWGTAEETEVKFDSNYAPAVNYTPGKDAKFEVEINGEKMQMTRPTNNVNLDGMSVALKGTFQAEEGEAVTFQRTTDSDKIVDAVRSMVNDYNEMMSEIRKQYATLPYRKSSNGSFSDYEPLTDEDKASMSESAIKAYEEKAKQGLLFNDRNLSGLYEKMLGIFTGNTQGNTQASAQANAQLRAMGISVTYSAVDGAAQLTLDENKLRSALDMDPDAVADAFTRTGDDGNVPGIMQSMKTQLDRYAGLTGATKGILVEQAGTPLSSLSLMNNTWQKEIDNISTEIEKWQDKLSAQVDKYTSMFSKLETLIYQMNSQSSSLAGMMGMG